MQTAYPAARLALKQTTRSRRVLADDNVARAQGGFREIRKGEKGHLVSLGARRFASNESREDGGVRNNPATKARHRAGIVLPTAGERLKRDWTPRTWGANVSGIDRAAASLSSMIAAVAWTRSDPSPS
ncbi:hypothetical protein MRX96_033195 [Rhipicephalus microplus]